MIGIYRIKNVFFRNVDSSKLRDPPVVQLLPILRGQIMKRNVLLLIGISILALSASGCRTANQGLLGQGLLGQQNQIFNAPQLGQTQQSLLGGGLPSGAQTQQALGQFGRNVGNRLSNGLINHGVNSLINAAL